MATENCVLCETDKTYEVCTLCDLKKYLALYGVARQIVCTELRWGAWKQEGVRKQETCIEYRSNCPISYGVYDIKMEV